MLVFLFLVFDSWCLLFLELFFNFAFLVSSSSDVEEDSSSESNSLVSVSSELETCFERCFLDFFALKNTAPLSFTLNKGKLTDGDAAVDHRVFFEKKTR